VVSKKLLVLFRKDVAKIFDCFMIVSQPSSSKEGKSTSVGLFFQVFVLQKTFLPSAKYFTCSIYQHRCWVWVCRCVVHVRNFSWECCTPLIFRVIF